jgi:hypothetical protein
LLTSTPGAVTPFGYSLMTQMAESVIYAMTTNLTLKGGWLQNEQATDGGYYGDSPVANVNSVSPNNTIQFVPVGYYSDGSQRYMLNPNFQGSNGTWTSSNPMVMYISQNGYATALSPGTAIIRYTSPGGVAILGMDHVRWQWY